MSKSSAVFTVFYSWQSDTPKGHCRHLIREALDEAAEQLNSDGEVPYTVAIDQDTQNLTGLCDIPAAILAKIADADAIVADLTYIAKTEDDEAKYCSNPNVLFELGYAFRAVGPDRLVCVMNEEHGPRTGQIFDLNHRRHPISYNSPTEEHSRNDIIRKLSDELCNALRPMVAKGPRKLSANQSTQHQVERIEIQSYIEGNSSPKAGPCVSFCLCPDVYRERRWQNSEALEKLLRERGVRRGSRLYPPQQTQTAAMPWGISNIAYREKWGMTYAGQFWCQREVAGLSQMPPIPEYMLAASPTAPSEADHAPGEWLDFIPTIQFIFECFRFCESLSHEFTSHETLNLAISGIDFSGRWLGSSSYEILDDPFGPSASPGFTRNFELTAEELQKNWKKRCVDCMKEMCDLFSRDGRRITEGTLSGWIGRFGG